MALTGTFVLAFQHDTIGAVVQAARDLSAAAIGLLVRYLACPPAPGSSREDVAASYQVSRNGLRAGNTELANAGHLTQHRRSLARGKWQHLILVTDHPGDLPAEHEAWALLDAALAAEAAADPAHDPGDISPESAHVATCGDAMEHQVTTCVEKAHIKPVNYFPSDPTDTTPVVVRTVADLKALSALPPLPAPEEQSQFWLTPGQVLSLMSHYPPRYGELAMTVLARAEAPWYLAPSVMALMIQGYSTAHLARALAGVHEAEHPAAVARWRLDQMLLRPEPDHVPWTAPSTVIRDGPPPDPKRAGRGAAEARVHLRANGVVA
ncbi:hypothetical protein [Herbidospora mongoliensis]|uniref:hypothetical protein n=1 Tax=Herbidospora mongoliensis TaxID=688067 RepID=UPI0008348A2A|nr:hypothetical protein [Herbidospora mongoliensis]